MTTLSILTPVFDPRPDHLRACLASVDEQTHVDLQHVVVDDASTDPAVAEVLADGARDPRRIVSRRAVNGGIVAASNDALALATGEFVVLLDHDDLLEPHAFERIAAALDGPDAGIDVVYSDHDLIRSDGRLVSPVYKPDHSPERLRNHNYITHLVALRRSVVEDVGGFRAGFDGAQDHDLLLRVTERGGAVVHVPEVLAHWRQSPASVSLDTANKPAAFDAGVRAVADHLERVGVDATVEPGAHDGLYRIRRRIAGAPVVSVVMPTRGSQGRVWGRRRTYAVEAVRSLLADEALRSRLEIVAVVDEGTPDELVEALGRLAGEHLVVVPFDRPFNFSEKIGAGVAASSGEYLLLLNDDTELLAPGGVDEMVGLAQQADVGMVGAKLLYDDGTLQHGGHVYHGTIDHACRGWWGEHPGPSRLLAVERECAGVCAAAALLRREVFDEVGGMNEDLPHNYNDVDLSLRVRATGRRVVWTPHAVWYHFESRSAPHPIEPWEIERLLARWPGVLDSDPYYNPNLAPGRCDWLERPGRSGAPPRVVHDDGTVSWA